MVRVSFVICVICLFFFSCEDQPGEGGKASIQGKVYVKDFTSNCAFLRDSFYGVDEEVFIIAGDDPSYFERVRTGPGGTFWFPYLRKGKYEVYALSDVCDSDEIETVSVRVEITDRKAEIIVEDLVVIR